MFQLLNRFFPSRVARPTRWIGVVPVLLLVATTAALPPTAVAGAITAKPDLDPMAHLGA